MQLEYFQGKETIKLLKKKIKMLQNNKKEIPYIQANAIILEIQKMN